MTFNAPRNRRSTEIDDDEPPIRFTLPMAAAIPVKSDKILDLHPSCIYAFTSVLVFQLPKFSTVSNCTWKIQMVNIVDGFQFRNNPPPRPSVLTASFKVVAAARTSTSGI